MLKMRILGLVSYFKSPQEKLMPKYDENLDFYIIDVPMSDFQFSVYEEARIQERKLEEYNKKKASKKHIEESYKLELSSLSSKGKRLLNFFGFSIASGQRRYRNMLPVFGGFLGFIGVLLHAPSLLLS